MANNSTLFDLITEYDIEYEKNQKSYQTKFDSDIRQLRSDYNATETVQKNIYDAHVEQAKADPLYASNESGLKQRLEEAEKQYTEGVEKRKKIYAENIKPYSETLNSETQKNRKVITEKLYQTMDNKSGFTGLKQDWEKIIADSGWTDMTATEQSRFLMSTDTQSTILRTLDKNNILTQEGLDVEAARKYVCGEAYDKNKEFRAGIDSYFENIGKEKNGTQRYSKGFMDTHFSGKKAGSIGEALGHGKFGGVGKMAIGALMTAGLVSALSDSRGSQTSAQLYGQAPLY